MKNKVNWDFFDEIKCINLYSREDRLKKSQKIFKKHSIPIKYHRVDRHPKGGAQGCYESHLSIIKEAYEKGYNNVLIFEDDIIASPYLNNELINEAISFMKKCSTWDIFYFGHRPYILKDSEVISSSIIKTHSHLTHAYVVSRRYMEKMIKSCYKGIAIDQIYVENDNAYALYPMAFYQDDLGSDIETSSPVRGLRSAELYAYHINYCLTDAILFTLLFICFIILSLACYKYL